MAQRDGTGPAGAGPKTGRGAGPCGDTAADKDRNVTPERGSGTGLGSGKRGNGQNRPQRRGNR